MRLPVEFESWDEWREFVRTRDFTWRDEYPTVNGRQSLDRPHIRAGMSVDEIADVLRAQERGVWSETVMAATGCV